MRDQSPPNTLPTAPDGDYKEKESHITNNNKDDCDKGNEEAKGTLSHPRDIYNFINRAGQLSDADKFDLMCNVWKPGKDYNFPYVIQNKRKRRFQQQWLSNFPWLTYSAAVNGGFCINCVLFSGETTHNSCKFQRLKTSPLLPNASIVQRLNDHAVSSKVHEMATV